MTRHGVCLAAGLAVCAAVVAHAERLPLRTLTTADGLANNVINAIVGDSRGFVWFCTREGLAQFDGHAFTTFGLADGLPSAAINTMVETTAGLYWIGTGDGLVRFDPYGGHADRVGQASRPTFIRYTPGTDHRVRRILSLLERRGGGIWVGTGLGLFRLESAGQSWRFAAEPLQGRTPEVSALAEDAAGTIWVGTSEGLFRWRPGEPAVRWTVEHGLPADRVLDVFVDTRQRVWVGTIRGLARLRSDAPTAGRVDRVYTAASGLGGQWVWQMTETSDGTLWVATDGGLARSVPSTTPDGERFRLYGPSSGLPSHHVSALAEDRTRTLWVGTRHGAARLLSGGFTIFNGDDGVATAATLALTRQGDVLVMEAVDEWRVNRYDGQRFVKTTIPVERLTNTWGWNQMFLVDRDGDAWLGSRSGVWRFSGAHAIEALGRSTPAGRYTSRHGLATDVVLRLFEDSRGDVWIGTVGEGDRRNGLSRWERASGRLHHYAETSGLPPLDQFYVSAFAEDRGGAVWIGLSGDGGLVRYRNGRFSAFGEADGVGGGTIRNLVLDSRGRLWAASYRAGLITTASPEASTPVFTRYSTSDGLSSNEVGAIVEDLQGRMLAGTARGIDVVVPDTRQVTTYRAADGLPPGEAQAAARDASGALWFTYLTGVVRMRPEARTPTVLPRVLITGIRVAGRALPLSRLGEVAPKAIDLPHTENAVDIDFVAPGFGPRDAQFQVQLEGGNQAWSRPSERRSVSFANLAPGSYRFLVRAVTPAGTASREAAAFAFTIQPPVWQRAWFLGAVALGAAGLAWSVIRVRTSRQRELATLRGRIARDLHDDIGANLTRIAVLAEVTRHEIGQAATVDHHLDAIAGVARESVASMGDIVWMVNPECDTLQALASKIREHAGEVLADRHMSFVVGVPDPSRVKLAGDVRRDLYLVAKEAITNAARHGRCSTVSIQLTCEPGRLVLTVADDGVGFTPTAATSGHGLANMRKRAARLHATLDVTSAPGAGTTVRLDVPTEGATHPA